MTRLFRNVAYAVQRVTLLLDEGGTETLAVTAGHSVWVEGQGWTPAELLLAGQTVKPADGRAATVLGSESMAHPEGIIVHNFSVKGDHSYVVDDRLGDIAAIWVHNETEPEKPVAISMDGGTAPPPAQRSRRIGLRASP